VYVTFTFWYWWHPNKLRNYNSLSESLIEHCIHECFDCLSNKRLLQQLTTNLQRLRGSNLEKKASAMTTHNFDAVDVVVVPNQPRFRQQEPWR
jgi:hypothetical protein